MSDSLDEERTAPNAFIGVTLAGRYRIDELLGAGGMGAVYRAEHVHMRKAVALKLLHREMMAVPEVVARFEREAIAAGRIEHPHVAAATDFGRLEDGSCYLVLEFVEGRSLAKLIGEQGTFEVGRALSIVRQIAEALSAAHAAGIVHRDLKPDNVMLVSKESDADFVKVLDFGIAKLSAEQAGDQPALTRIGTVFGTPEYMSPEQARGELVDARSDLYAVGMILYEMLRGVSPFRDTDLVVMLTRQLTAEPPPLGPEVPEGVRRLVEALLKKNSDERLQTAVELVARIDALSAAGAPRARAVPAPLGLLARRVQLGGRTLSLGALVLSFVAGSIGVAALIVGVSLAVRAVRTHGGVLAAVAAAAKPEERTVELVAKAERGDAQAIAKLAARPEDGRSALEWRAIAHGTLKLGRGSEALEVYAEGVAKEPTLAQDPLLLGDVRRAAEDPASADRALEFAARALGTSGLDLIYDLWDSNRNNPARVDLAKRARAYLDADDAAGKAGPALAVLLELTRTQRGAGCLAVRKLLPRVAEQADARSLPFLHRLEDHRGCGFLGLGDCYSCLRASKDLAQAIKAAAGRPAPAFAVP